MATEAQFMPAAGPGAITAASHTGFQQGLNMMERSQAMRQRDELMQRQRIQDEIMLPVMRAKANADLVAATSQIDGARRAEETRMAAQSMLPMARTLFDEAVLSQDPEMREAAILRWMAEFSPLASVNEFSAEFGAKKEIAANLLKEAQAVRALRAQTDQAKELIGERGQVARDVAGIRATSPARSEFTTLMSGLDAAKASGDQEAAEYYRGRIERLTHIPEARKQKVEALLELRRAAEEAGDGEAVRIYDAAVEKEITITSADPMKQAIADQINRSQGAPAAARAPAPVAQPTAPAPAQAAPAAAPKRYQVQEDKVIIPDNLSPEDYVKALQQAVDDGIIDADQARSAMVARGFKKK